MTSWNPCRPPTWSALFSCVVEKVPNPADWIGYFPAVRKQHALRSEIDHAAQRLPIPARIRGKGRRPEIEVAIRTTNEVADEEDAGRIVQKADMASGVPRRVQDGEIAHAVALGDCLNLSTTVEPELRGILGSRPDVCG